MKLKLHEHIARYVLGIVYLFGAVDGGLGLFFDIHLVGKASEGSLLGVLQDTTWFWAFLKLVQLIGALSLLLNYRPALGVALLTPISAVLCLFYVFGLHWYFAFALVGAANLVLIRAYWASYQPMLEPYPMRVDPISPRGASEPVS